MTISYAHSSTLLLFVLIGTIFLSALVSSTTPLGSLLHFLPMGIGALTLITWIVTGIIHKKLTLTLAPWATVFLLITFSMLTTLLFTTPNPLQSIVSANSLVVGCTILYLIATSSAWRFQTSTLVFSTSVFGCILTFLQLASLFGWVSIHNPILAFVLVLIALAMYSLFDRGGYKRTHRILYAIPPAILTIGVVTCGFTLLQSTILLPWVYNWMIALDVIKSPKQAIIGVGLDHYAQAFSLYRPVALNSLPYWETQFMMGRNVLFDSVVTTGIAGLLAMVVLLVQSVRYIPVLMRKSPPLAGALGVIILSLLLFPPYPFLFLLLTIIVIAATPLVIGEHPTSYSLQIPKLYISLILVLVPLWYLSLVYKEVRSQLAWKQTIQAVSQNDLKKTYDHTYDAVSLTPYHTELQRAFATISLTSAQTIAAKEDLSDDDRHKVGELVAQAVERAKLAVAIDTTQKENWQVLATMYEGIFGLSDQAKKPAVEARLHAISLSPTDPILRFEAARTLRLASDSASAATYLQQTIDLKPDFANAYFNLADIARESGDKVSEYSLLQSTKQLIGPKDPNYTKLSTAVTDLEKELQQMQEKEKQAPSPVPSPTPSTTSAKKKVATASAKPVATESASPQ